MPNTLTRLAFWFMRRGLTLPIYQIEQYQESWQILQVLKERQIDCVLDVGANQGQFVERLRLMGYKQWIISFEPNPKAFSRLSQIVDSKLLAYCMALGQEDARMTFHIPSHDVLGSFLIHTQSPSQETIDVPVRRLDSLLDEIIEKTGARRLLLKLDTQGFDLEVTRGAGDRLHAFDALLSEVSVTPVYRGIPHYTEALREYEASGFILHSMYPVFKSTNGAVIEYNAIMLRAKSPTAG